MCAAMDVVIDILIAASLFAVLIPLGWGLYAMARGGEYDRAHSTRLMGWRVKLQAVAILMLCIGFWYKATH